MFLSHYRHEQNQINEFAINAYGVTAYYIHKALVMHQESIHQSLTVAVQVTNEYKI